MTANQQHCEPEPWMLVVGVRVVAVTAVLDGPFIWEPAQAERRSPCRLSPHEHANLVRKGRLQAACRKPAIPEDTLKSLRLAAHRGRDRPWGL